MAGRKRSYETPFKLKVTNYVVQFHAKDRYRLCTSVDLAVANMRTHTPIIVNASK